MNIKPLQDRILVKRNEQEEEVRGGIIIPDSAKEKPLQARVIAAGPGKRNEKGELQPMDIKVDDIILLGKYAGNEIKFNDEDMIILRQDEVLAIIEG